MQVQGAARLRRWGLLGRIAAAGTPPTRRLRFDAGGVVLEGRYPEVDGVDALYGPRRTVLGAVLVDAARQAGAEVRECFVVDELVCDGADVAGVRGHEMGAGGGRRIQESARIVIGADGRHSMVAKALGADAYRTTPPLSIAYNTYWADVPVEGGEIYAREGRMVGAWPTNGGQLMTYMAAPADEFGTFRRESVRHAARHARRVRRPR